MGGGGDGGGGGGGGGGDDEDRANGRVFFFSFYKPLMFSTISYNLCFSSWNVHIIMMVSSWLVKISVNSEHLFIIIIIF